MSDLIDRRAIFEAVEALPKWDKRTVPGGFHVHRLSVLQLIDSQPAAPSPALTREALAAEIAAMGPATPFELADAILSALMEQRQ